MCSFAKTCTLVPLPKAHWFQNGRQVVITQASCPSPTRNCPSMGRGSLALVDRSAVVCRSAACNSSAVRRPVESPIFRWGPWDSSGISRKAMGENSTSGQDSLAALEKFLRAVEFFLRIFSPENHHENPSF